jgi:hypothetical protein
LAYAEFSRRGTSFDTELSDTHDGLPGFEITDSDIPFYDAGIDNKPDRYKFVVAGSARFIGPEGKPIDCWLVTADYNSGKVQSRFWFAKKGLLMLREEEQMDDGRILLKVLLPPERGDEGSGVHPEHHACLLGSLEFG